MYGILMYNPFHLRIPEDQKVRNSTYGALDSPAALAVSCSAIGLVALYIAIMCLVDAIKMRRANAQRGPNPSAAESGQSHQCPNREDEVTRPQTRHDWQDSGNQAQELRALVKQGGGDALILEQLTCQGRHPTDLKHEYDRNEDMAVDIGKPRRPIQSFTCPTNSDLCILPTLPETEVLDKRQCSISNIASKTSQRRTGCDVSKQLLVSTSLKLEEVTTMATDTRNTHQQCTRKIFSPGQNIPAISYSFLRTVLLKMVSTAAWTQHQCLFTTRKGSAKLFLETFARTSTVSDNFTIFQGSYRKNRAAQEIPVHQGEVSDVSNEYHPSIHGAYTSENWTLQQKKNQKDFNKKISVPKTRQTKTRSQKVNNIHCPECVLRGKTICPWAAIKSLHSHKTWHVASKLKEKQPSVDINLPVNIQNLLGEGQELSSQSLTNQPHSYIHQK